MDVVAGYTAVLDTSVVCSAKLYLYVTVPAVPPVLADAASYQFVPCVAFTKLIEVVDPFQYSSPRGLLKVTELKVTSSVVATPWFVLPRYPHWAFEIAVLFTVLVFFNSTVSTDVAFASPTTSKSFEGSVTLPVE